VAVSWLHISDFHIQTGDPYDRDVVLKALVQSVDWHRTHGHPVDLIFATGDIAHSGQTAEYEIATRFFDDLLKAAHLNKDRLFLIPGNHDVDRDAGEALLRTLGSEESAIKYFLPGKVKLHLTEKQAAFLAWHDSYFPGRTWPRDSTCGPIAAIEINNQPIAILPINSALFCLDDFDHNKLWVGRRPLEAAIEGVPQRALKIALIHHPLDWLNDAERTNIKALLTDHFDVILRGHLHETEAEPPVFAAGAAYQKRVWPNRAMFASFDNGRLTVFPIRYEDSPRPFWTVDPSLYATEPGYQKIFPLARFAQTSAPATPSTAVPAPARPIPSNIPVRFGSFIGRADDLKNIAERLASQPALVLHGLSGAGKSELAREYARLHRAEYSGGAFFLNASPAILATDLARIGQTYFDVRFEPDLPIRLQAQRTLSTLSATRLLFLYDSAESIASIRDFLPPAGSACHSLITTVADPWQFDLPTLRIDPLPHHFSLDLIRAIGGEDVAQAYGDQLAESAGGLPIQIVPAARMLRHERDKGQLSSARITLSAEAAQSFRGVYDRLDADSQLLLHAALQFNSQRIVRDELAAHLAEGAEWQSDQFTKCLDICSDLHLLEGAPELRMHQLFAHFLHQSTLPPELAERLRSVRKFQAQRFVQYSRQVGDKPTDADAVSKFLAFPFDCSSWDREAFDGGEAHSIGYALGELARWDEAKPWSERAVELKQQADAEGRIDHESLGSSLYNLGWCLFSAGQLAEAKSWFERSAAERAQGDLTGGLNHEGVAKSLHEVGSCEFKLGQYQEAQSWFERAVKETEQGNLAGRVDHDSLGRSLGLIGICLSKTGNYEEAKPWFERATPELEQGDLQDRVDHEVLGRIIGYLALCNAKTGNLPQALSLRERAVAEKRQGDYYGRIDKASLARELRDTASLLRKLNRPAEAQTYEAEANQLDPPKP
jgi:tetratricopeptide (TPR) repeat protein/predicted phosphodiesterase